MFFSLTSLAFEDSDRGFPRALGRVRVDLRTSVLEQCMQICAFLLAPFEVRLDLAPDRVVGCGFAVFVCVVKQCDYRWQLIGHSLDPRRGLAFCSLAYLNRELDEVNRSSDQAKDRGGFADASHRVLTSERDKAVNLRSVVFEIPKLE